MKQMLIIAFYLFSNLTKTEFGRWWHELQQPLLFTFNNYTIWKPEKGGKTEISTFTDGEKIISRTHTHKNIRQKKPTETENKEQKSVIVSNLRLT
jgi:hypothetical protein